MTKLLLAVSHWIKRHCILLILINRLLRQYNEKLNYSKFNE